MTALPEGPSPRLTGALDRLAGAGGRLLLHAGTPKTGSTALQRALSGSSDLLAQQGVCYPDNTASLADPKHSWLPSGLATQDEQALEDGLCEAVDQALARDAPTVFLSSEGLYRQWGAYAPWAHTWVAGLTQRVPVELWLLLREPVGFFASAYQQVLRSSGAGARARTQSAGALLERGLAQVGLDYDAFVTWWEQALTPASVRVDLYDPDLTDTVRRALGVHGVDVRTVRENTSLTGVGCALLRELSGLHLTREAHAQALQHVTTIDRLVTDQLGRQPILDEQTAREVADRARPSLTRLVARRPELAPLLDPPAQRP